MCFTRDQNKHNIMNQPNIINQLNKQIKAAKSMYKNVITQKAVASLLLKLSKNVPNRYKRKVKKIQNHSISGYREI